MERSWDAFEIKMMQTQTFLNKLAYPDMMRGALAHSKIRGP